MRAPENEDEYAVCVYERESGMEMFDAPRTRDSFALAFSFSPLFGIESLWGKSVYLGGIWTVIVSDAMYNNHFVLRVCVSADRDWR